MRNIKRSGAIALATVVAFGLGTVSVITANAASPEGQPTFIEQVAAKLGLKMEDVQKAISEVKGEMRANKKVEMETKVNKAVENGDLTEKEASIVKGQGAIRESMKQNKPEKGTLDQMTKEERKAFFKNRKESFVNDLISKLKSDYNIDTTKQELKDLKGKLQDLGIFAKRGRGNGYQGGRRSQDAKSAKN